MTTKKRVTDNPKLQFTDISTEIKRTYVFREGDEVVINSPTHLNVSRSGGHRLLDAQKESHYIPAGWIHLHWTTKDDAPAFVK